MEYFPEILTRAVLKYKSESTYFEQSALGLSKLLTFIGRSLLKLFNNLNNSGSSFDT